MWIVYKVDGTPDEAAIIQQKTTEKLLNIVWWNGIHVSCRNIFDRWYCIVSTDGLTSVASPLIPYQREIIKLYLDSSDTIPHFERLAHSYSDQYFVETEPFATCPMSSYWAQNHASISPSGSQIIFRSTWGPNCFAEDYILQWSNATGSVIPTITLSASPTSVAYNGTSVLTWSSTGATSCTTNWGSTATGGSFTTPALMTNTTYNLSCTWAWGTASGSVTVTVVADPNPILMGIAPNTALDLQPYKSYDCLNLLWHEKCSSRSDYSRFTYDSEQHKMLFFWGGHGSSSTFMDNVDTLSLLSGSTLDWVEDYPTTPCSEMLPSNMATLNLSAYPGDGGDGRWISTNHPYARHTYDNLVYHPGVKHLILLAQANGGGWCVRTHTEFSTVTFANGDPIDPFYLKTKTAQYDTHNKLWSFDTTINPWNVYSASEYDPISNKIVILHATGLWLYDVNTRSWSLILTQAQLPSGMYAWQNLIYYPPTDKFYYIEPEEGPSVQVFEVTINRTNVALSSVVEVTGMTNIPSAIVWKELGWAYDSNNQEIGWGIVNWVFHSYDPIHKSWTGIIMQTSSASWNSIWSMNFHALDYDPLNNVYIFQSSASPSYQARTWAYRPPHIPRVATLELVAQDGMSETQPIPNDWWLHEPRITSHADGTTRFVYLRRDPSNQVNWWLMSRDPHAQSWTQEASGLSQDDVTLMRNPVTDQAYVVSWPNSQPTVYGSPSYSWFTIPWTWQNLNQNARHYGNTGIGTDGSLCIKESIELSDPIPTKLTQTRYACGKNNSGSWLWNMPITMDIWLRRAYDYIFPGWFGDPTQIVGIAQLDLYKTAAGIPLLNNLQGNYVFNGMSTYTSSVSSGANWNLVSSVAPRNISSGATIAPILRQSDAFIDHTNRMISTYFLNDPSNPLDTGLYIIGKNSNNIEIFGNKLAELPQYGYTRIFEDARNRLWLLWTNLGSQMTQVKLYQVSIQGSGALLTNMTDLSSQFSPYAIQGSPFIATPRGGQSIENELHGFMVACDGVFSNSSLASCYPSGSNKQRLLYFKILLPE